jgi:DNA-directed RNA polymerase specialized sigma24 family protein
MDDDPEGAAAGFHEFAWKLLRSHPPPAFQGLAPHDREDIIADLVARFLSNGFKVLRGYKDRGKPFAGYLATAANNRAKDHWRRVQDEKKKSKSFDDPSDDGASLRDQIASPEAGQDVRLEDRMVLERVQRCLGNLSERCQVLLHGAADGLRPRELTILLGWPQGWNKKAHDALRECRRSLVRCMEKQHELTEQRA